MKQSFFMAKCDVEIGDIVKFKTTGEILTIDDIKTTYYLKSGKIKWEFKLKNNAVTKWWHDREEFIYPIE